MTNPFDFIPPDVNPLDTAGPMTTSDLGQGLPRPTATTPEQRVEAERQRRATWDMLHPGAIASTEPRNEWKEAVLNALAAWPGMDFAQDIPPRTILEAVLKIEREAALTVGNSAAAASLIPELPTWWPKFIENICELPDRNSPEDEPEALVATPDELENCAMRAMEQCQ